MLKVPHPLLFTSLFELFGTLKSFKNHFLVLLGSLGYGVAKQRVLLCFRGSTRCFDNNYGVLVGVPTFWLTRGAKGSPNSVIYGVFVVPLAVLTTTTAFLLGCLPFG